MEMPENERTRRVFTVTIVRISMDYYELAGQSSNSRIDRALDEET